MLVFQGWICSLKFGPNPLYFAIVFLIRAFALLDLSPGISSSPAGLSDQPSARILHSERIKKHRRLDLVERSVLVFPHIVENGARGPADELETPPKFVQVAWIFHTSS
jgi:hypothetical protein